MAKKFNLPVFAKQESQDICFISKDVASFLQKYLKLKKGKIMDETGRILGTHKGLALYTPGQRKGINVGGQGPYFVVGKDNKKNNLIVTNKSQSPALYSKEIKLENVNWIVGEPELPAKINLRTRYRNPLVSAIIKAQNEKLKAKSKTYKITFDQPQKAVASGQSAVFYGEKKEVLGGGIIKVKN